MNKKIINISNPQYYHMVGDGFRVHNYLPGYGKRMSEHGSPFLMLDYNSPQKILADGVRRGVGFHPHRGIETVTLVYGGEVTHRDTAGNSGTIGVGDVQWMTAGSGLLHEELSTQDFADRGGIQEFVQIWVNLPKEKKMMNPTYQTLLSWDIPVIQSAWTRVRVIAGQYDGTSWIAQTQSQIELYDIHIENGSRWEYVFSPWETVFVLVRSGLARTQESALIQTRDFVEYSTEGKSLSLEAKQDTDILVMAWIPLGDTVVHDGPFVMNTQKEILQAWEDFESGKMGKII